MCIDIPTTQKYVRRRDMIEVKRVEFSLKERWGAEGNAWGWVGVAWLLGQSLVLVWSSPGRDRYLEEVCRAGHESLRDGIAGRSELLADFEVLDAFLKSANRYPP